MSFSWGVLEVGDSNQAPLKCISKPLRVSGVLSAKFPLVKASRSLQWSLPLSVMPYCLLRPGASCESILRTTGQKGAVQHWTQKTWVHSLSVYTPLGKWTSLLSFFLCKNMSYVCIYDEVRSGRQTFNMVPKCNKHSSNGYC